MSDLPKGFTLVSDDDPSIPKGFSLLEEDEQGTASAVGETALNIVTGGLAQIPAGLAGIASGLDADVVKKVNEALTYEPRGKKGKEFTEKTGKFLEQKVRQPMIKQAIETSQALPFDLDPNQRELLGTIASDTFLNFMPLDVGLRGAKAAKGKPTPELPKDKLNKLDQLTQQKSDLPPGFTEVQPELDLFSPDQKKLGSSPYDAVGGNWLVDENGIPVKQRLSEDVSRAADAEQGRLFEDPRGPVDSGTQKALLAEQEAKAAREAEIAKRTQIDEAFQQREQGKALEARVAELKQKLEAPVRRAPRGQRGAIDTEAVKEITDLFKRGVASARDLLDSWKGAFTENELGVARKAIDNPKSLDTVVFMKPEQFHELATKRSPAELNAEYTPRLRSSIEEGLKSKSGLWEMPYLRVDNEGKVTAHEGRHRMDVFTEQGYELVPVRLRKEAGEGWGTWKHPEKLIPQDFKNSPKAIQELGAVDFPQVIHAKQSPQLPKNQRGGLDIKGIGEGVKKLVNSVTRKETKADKADTGTPKEKALEDIPGIKSANKDTIPPDPTASSILEESLGAGDSSLKMTGVQSGATMTGIKYDSPLIRGIGRLYQNAQKRSDKLIRDFVYPVEYDFKKLKTSEITELADVMKMEMFDGREIPIEKLRQAGFTKNQINAYTKMRDLFNKAYEAQVAALEAQNKKIPTKREAYLASRWNGDWHVPVYTKDGKLVYYIAEKSKAQAHNALEYLKERFDLDLDKSKVSFKAGFSKRGEVFDAYRTMLSIIDSSDPRADAIKSVFEEAMANDAYNAIGQKKHFESKANVRGFLGDRPWTTPKANAYDLFKSQFDYAKNAFTWTELQKATKTSKEVLSNDYLLQEQPNNVNYAQQYAKNKLGFGDSAWVSQMENAAAELLGQSKQSFYNVIGDMKSFFIITKLGLNTGFMAANMIQPVFTLPWHGNLLSQGYKHNPLKTFVQGGYDAIAGYAKYALGAELPMSELGKKALQYAEDNGIVRRSMFDETANIGRHAGVEFAEKVGSSTIQTVEHSARLNAFMGFVHHLEQSGKFTDEIKMLEKAEELTNAAMVDYRPGEGPMMFDKAGMTGEALKTLQTFKFNYYNQMHYFLKEAKEGRPRALITFMALQGMLGGALGLPLLQEIDDLWETIRDSLPNDIHMDVKDFGIKKKLIETLPDWASYGGLSKLTGANFSSRFDSGNLVDFSLDSLFPFIKDISNQVSKVAQVAKEPGEATKAEALYALAPPGPVQGLIETNMDAFKGPKTPEGNQVYLNPRDLRKEDASFVRTPEQEAYRQGGLVELSEAKYKGLRFTQNKMDKESEARRGEIAERFLNAVLEQDKKRIDKYVYQYMRYDGDSQALIDRLDGDLMRRRFPAETLQGIRAQTLAAVQKAKRMKELLGGFNK